MPTKIGWTKSDDGSPGETWNPVTGCSHASSGCLYCYAERLSRRFNRTTLPWIGPNARENVVLHPDRLDIPLGWRQPRRIFVCSMADLFHEQVPDVFIAQVFTTMLLARQHTFLILTKRAERMWAWVRGWLDHLPLGDRSHIWLGVSAEDQKMADERIPHLIDTPSTVRFLSLEPLLGPIDLSAWLLQPPDEQAIHWIITGGESGGPPERRLVTPCPYPEHTICICSGTGWAPKPDALTWVRSLRDQAVGCRIPFFFEQWGGPSSTSGGNLLSGRTWEEFPAVPQTTEPSLF